MTYAKPEGLNSNLYGWIWLASTYVTTHAIGPFSKCVCNLLIDWLISCVIKLSGCRFWLCIMNGWIWFAYTYVTSHSIGPIAKCVCNLLIDWLIWYVLSNLSGCRFLLILTLYYIMNGSIWLTSNYVILHVIGSVSSCVCNLLLNLVICVKHVEHVYMCH